MTVYGYARSAADDGDTVVVTRLDRLARSTRDLLNTLAAIGAANAMFSLHDAWANITTPHGRLILTVSGGLAEFACHTYTPAVSEKLRALRLNRAAELAEAAVGETLTYYAFPEEHWRRIRANNPLERILREIRRRTRVVGAFPDGQSALHLAAASSKRYLNIELLKDQQMRGAITA